MYTRCGMSRRLRVAVALGSVLGALTAVGQDAPVDVLAIDFGSTVTSFEARSKLIIEALNLTGDRSELEARLFRGSPRELLNNHRAVEIQRQKCIIFQSTTKPIRDSGGGKLDLGWVPPAGQWTLVFHKGRWASNLIPIKEDAIAEYFRRGFVFTVRPERADARHAFTYAQPASGGRVRPAIVTTFSSWFRGGAKRPEVVYRVAPPEPVGESDLQRCFFIRTTPPGLLRARLESCRACESGTGDDSAGGEVDTAPSGAR